MSHNAQHHIVPCSVVALTMCLAGAAAALSRSKGAGETRSRVLCSAASVAGLRSIRQRRRVVLRMPQWHDRVETTDDN